MSKLAQPDMLAGHFALILATLAAGPSHLVGLANTQATCSLANALTQLGASISQTGTTWRVTGRGLGGLIEPTAPLPVGTDPIAANLLLGVIASHPVFAVLSGTSAPHPCAFELAEQLGACIAAPAAAGLPIAITGAADALPVELATTDPIIAATALLAGLNARGQSRITCANAAGLAQLLHLFGATLDQHSDTLVLHGQPELRPASISIPHASRLIIAVDGPAAAGKGTLARSLAAHFALPYLDTGLLYRATGRRVLDASGDPANPTHAAPAAQALTPQDLHRPDLRGPEADRAASAVASIPAVRAALLDFQRNFGSAHGAVLDGRDIGTQVFPQAPVKLFITASPQARGARRHAELASRGISADLADVTQDIEARDHADRTREAAPMTPAPDAITIDTTEMNAAEALQAALDAITGSTRPGP